MGSAPSPRGLGEWPARALAPRSGPGPLVAVVQPAALVVPEILARRWRGAAIERQTSSPPVCRLAFHVSPTCGSRSSTCSATSPDLCLELVLFLFISFVNLDRVGG